MVVLPLVPVTPMSAQLAVGMAVEAGGQRGHRGARGVDQHLGRVEAERALDNERGRAPPQCLGGEARARRCAGR